MSKTMISHAENFKLYLENICEENKILDTK